jgi:hypothetical protein
MHTRLCIGSGVKNWNLEEFDGNRKKSSTRLRKIARLPMAINPIG